MTTKIITTPTDNGQKPPLDSLTDRQAIALARAACASLLHGEPDPVTFDQADLDLAIRKLGAILARSMASDGEVLYVG